MSSKDAFIDNLSDKQFKDIRNFGEGQCYVLAMKNTSVVAYADVSAHVYQITSDVFETDGIYKDF
jgi:hypothetical protein